jgi:hypothetical protein
MKGLQAPGCFRNDQVHPIQLAHQEADQRRIQEGGVAACDKATLVLGGAKPGVEPSQGVGVGDQILHHARRKVPEGPPVLRRHNHLIRHSRDPLHDLLKKGGALPRQEGLGLSHPAALAAG